MDYQTYRTMTKPSKTRKTFTKKKHFCRTQLKLCTSIKNKSTPKKNTKILNHVCSHYWNLPNTSTISVNFPDNPHPPQDYSENYPFF